TGPAAVLEAGAAFTADLKLLDSGFLANVYGIAPTPSVMTDGLGTAVMLPQVSFKPWCAARQTMAATQALREVMAAGTAAPDIGAIEVRVPPPHLKMIDHGVVAGDRASHLTSGPYQVAGAALQPAAAFDVRGPPKELTPEVAAFMTRVKVAGDDALLAAYPSAWPARIAVETRSGVRERAVTHVPGDPARPMSAGDIAAKFSRLAAPAIGDARAAEPFGRSIACLDDRRALATLHEALDLALAAPPW